METLLLIIGISLTTAFNCDSSTKIDFKTCCNLPSLYPDEYITACTDLYAENTFKELTMNLPGPKRGSCIADCILTKIDVNPYENGILNRTAFKEHVMTAIASDPVWSSWTDHFSKVFDDCFELAESRSEDFKVSFALHPVFEHEKLCHPISGAVMSCIEADFFVNCPRNLWKGDRECENMKKFASICKALPFLRV